ncbi:MAG: virulence RhuM family protein [Bacteroidetes bacterium]|nr:virulence RhuM family protein [Bacteroidota bacterium]HET6245894.1 virulence RhuM family protein [Bacteroidia bacterium]
MEKFEILLYSTAEGDGHIEVFFENETFWLSQKKMAELFNVDVRTINEHLQNIFKSNELEEDSVIRKFRITASDGKNYNTNFYTLDAIIAVGYRVNSVEATRFRIWATKTLREFIIKGFVMDDERLKQGKNFGRDYFDELLERIREIRASERRFYQKITDIYSQCSIDYDPQAEITRTFYKTVQNKLHWAITGNTAAEIVKTRANSLKLNMGLSTWKNAPNGKILKSDVAVAKNYLNQQEIDELNRVVSMYLDYAENQTKKQVPMAMNDWVEKLDAFLSFNDYKVLKDAGKIRHKIAEKLAEKEYEKYRIIQDANFISDFDKEVKKLKGNKNKLS